ncbi:MAG: hypothetical protein V4615_01115 [Bacteroidota bacterium]
MADKKDYRDEFLDKQLTEAERKKARYEQTLHALQTEERFVNYLNGFLPSSVERFSKSYASRKVMWYESAAMMKSVRESRESRWNKIAESALVQIQEQKLQDIQHDWGNNKITLPQIQVFPDLVDWHQNVLNCPFLPPVSEGEIQLYLQFYDELIKESDEEEKLDHDEDSEFVFEPFRANDLSKLGYEWKRFIDRKNGVAPNRLIQNPRLSMESFYISLANKEDERIKQQREEEAKNVDPKPAVVQPPLPQPQKTVPPVPPAVDNRPFMHSVFYNPRLYENFVKKFDTKETLGYYRVMQREHKRREFMERVEMDLFVLKDSKEYVPIGSHDDWRDAVAEAAEQWSRKMVREAITDWWEVYARIKDNSGVYEYLNSVKPSTFNAENRKAYIARVIRGRVLNGKPPDLNF